MSLPLWLLSFVGAFYLAFGIIIAVRACRPSCRLCVYWQECSASAELGLPSAARAFCLAQQANNRAAATTGSVLTFSKERRSRAR